MLFTSRTLLRAFDNAADGKCYLTPKDAKVFFLEVFGQTPPKRVIQHLFSGGEAVAGGKTVGITFPRLKEFIEELGFAASANTELQVGEVHSLFTALDSRGQNFLTLADVCSTCGVEKSRALKGAIRRAFCEFDVDRDGRVSFGDFMAGLKRGGQLPESVGDGNASFDYAVSDSPFPPL
ncbi:EF-hand calcium-binding domain-containing protein 11 [Sparganum proliferum]